MSYMEAELASQPECWRQAADLVGSTTALRGLPEPGERVAVIGCGSSFHGAWAYAARREHSGHGVTDAWPASELPVHRHYDRVVAITRTGTTTEVLTALRRVPAGVPRVVVTADGKSAVTAVVDHTVALDFADEHSVVQTRFATTALVLLRAHLGEDVRPLAGAASAAIDQPLPRGLHSRKLLTFLGTGWTIGLAHEASHKLRETAQVWTDAYSAMEYRHGANCLADQDTLVWIMGEPPPHLVDETRGAGATVLVTGDDPLVDLVRVHRLAVELATAKGLDPDRPRNLARSVVLDSGGELS